MAKIQWLVSSTEGLGGEVDLSLNAKHTKATYNLSGGGQLVFQGEDFKMKNGELIDGSVDRVIFKGTGGEVAITAEGHYDAAKLGDAAAGGSAFGVYMSLFGGNDTIIGADGNDNLGGLRGDDMIFGGKGADTIAGGRGDDELTGGKGVDYFTFSTEDGVGDDVIHDLQVSGSARDNISIGQDITKVKSVHNGEDTMLTLENGSTILVEHVTKAEWTDYYVL